MRIRYFPLIRVFSRVFECQKCGMRIEASRQPNSGGCPAGGTHRWRTIVF